MPKHKEILDALQSRRDWENRQATWYQMRHDGIRRTQKPFKNASDMHFPLADMQIDKAKPNYVDQIFAQELLVEFRANDAGLRTYESGNAQWFHYQLTQRTNFEKQINRAIDSALWRGKGILKWFWDADGERLRCQAINPIYIIVPPTTDELEETDWLVHVQHYSLYAYKRVDVFTQDEAFIRSITGQSEEGRIHEQEKYSREGITRGADDQTIVIWEVWQREGKGWKISTYSPLKPDTAVRPDFKCPYNKGIFANGGHPFCEFTYEEKEEGYYSGRGITEKVAPFEASLNKDWNSKNDYQTFSTVPVFVPGKDVQIPNTANLTLQPGKLFPWNVSPIQFPAIPGDLWNSMAQTRMVAEQAVGTPDFGTGNTQMGGGGGKKTATETNVIANVFGASLGLKARNFRRELSHAYKIAWALLIQYASDQLSFWYRTDLGTLDQKGLTDGFGIEPSGSGDNINRQLILQKAIARKQMFTGNPNVNQYELDKSVLEADDPRLVARLLMDNNTSKQDQIEDQAQEITVMLMGFSPVIKAGDDDMAHLESLVAFVAKHSQKGPGIPAESLAIIAQHAAGHLQALKRKNPQQFSQKGAQLQMWIKEVQQHAQQAAQAEAVQAQAMAAATMPSQQAAAQVPPPAPTMQPPVPPQASGMNPTAPAPLARPNAFPQ
jgi:hypothetical protein